MKQGRKAIICFNKKSKGISIFEVGNANNFLWGCYCKGNSVDIYGAWGAGNFSEDWGTSAISLAGGSGLFADPELLFIVPNVQGYIANNYIFNGANPHTQGLAEKYMLCVEAYRTSTSGTPVIRYATDENENTTSYKTLYSMNVTATTPTIYRMEVTFKQNYRIELRSAKGCGNFIVNNIWLEEIE